MNNTPYETLEQQALFDWAKISGIPGLELLHGDTLYIYGKDDELVGLYKLDQVILADKT